jgi:predicted NBD/HSP70 family sugar kinase
VTGIDRALLADIGGTNARFALLDGGQIGPVEHTKVADYATVADAIAAFLTRHAGRGSTDAAILDVAGPAATADRGGSRFRAARDSEGRRVDVDLGSKCQGADDRRALCLCPIATVAYCS